MEETFEKKSRYEMDEINWEELLQIGITPELISRVGQMPRLLQGERTGPILITPTIFGYSLEMAVTLILEGATDLRPTMRIEGIRRNG